MPLSPPLVLEVGIVLQVPTPSALPHTWTLKWVYKELGSATGNIFDSLPFSMDVEGIVGITLTSQYIVELPTSSLNVVSSQWQPITSMDVYQDMCLLPNLLCSHSLFSIKWFSLLEHLFFPSLRVIGKS
jgi:hypothetical protein